MPRTRPGGRRGGASIQGATGGKLLGVHVIGTGATELVHIGQTVMAAGLPIDYFVESVFNYPTLAECYKVAALDGINRVRPASAAGRAEPPEGETKPLAA